MYPFQRQLQLQISITDPELCPVVDIPLSLDLTGRTPIVQDSMPKNRQWPPHTALMMKSPLSNPSGTECRIHQAALNLQVPRRLSNSGSVNSFLFNI